ncbi:TPA: hypothetical protein ACXNIS_003211 [Providencia rettgeri]
MMTDNNFSSHENIDRITFNELLSLIDLATSMQDSISKKRYEIKKILYISMAIMYIVIASIFFFTYFITTTPKLITTYIIFVSFIFITLAPIFYRIKTLRKEISIEMYMMKDIMEIIFNLRKIFPRNTISKIDITILDLKLRRLKFY